jgi:hypothetical protein
MRASEHATWMSRILKLAAVVALSPVLFAQTSGQPARTPLDIAGMWQQAEGETMFRPRMTRAAKSV